MNDPDLKITVSHDIHSYIQSRKPSSLEQVSPQAERILSSFLTFPLTLGHGLRLAFPSFFPSLTSSTTPPSSSTKTKKFSFFQKDKKKSTSYPFQSSFDKKYSLDLPKKELRVTVIGARAESALHLTWWKEMLVAFAPFVKVSFSYFFFLFLFFLPKSLLSFFFSQDFCAFSWSWTPS